VLAPDVVALPVPQLPDVDGLVQHGVGSGVDVRPELVELRHLVLLAGARVDSAAVLRRDLAVRLFQDGDEARHADADLLPPARL
jgi:hypothetical protein